MHDPLYYGRNSTAVRRAFADIVSKEIEDQRLKKRNFLEKHQTGYTGDLRDPSLSSNEICPSIESFTSLTHVPTRLLSTRVNIDRNCSVPLLCRDTEWNDTSPTYYGYSDSEDSSIISSRPSSSDDAVKRGYISATTLSNMSSDKQNPIRHHQSVERRHRKISSSCSPNFITARLDEESRRPSRPPLSKISNRVPEASRYHRKTGTSSFKREESKVSAHEEISTSQLPNGITAQKIRDLVQENLSLRKELELFKGELEAFQKKTEDERIKLLDTMADKHQRRVQLIKEEFDYRLATEQEKAQAEIARVSQQENDTAKRAKELEQRIIELEISEKLAQEKAQNEKNKAETETKHIDALKEQISASLSTVSQFSEKNVQLVKQLEHLKKEAEDKERLEQRLSEALQKYDSLSHDYGRLSEELREKLAQLEKSRSEWSSKDQELHQLLEELAKKEGDVATERSMKERLELKCSALESEILTLKSEVNVLQERHAECLEVARSSWGEVAAVKQEATVLRQQLAQQELVMEKLKQFAKGHRVPVLSKPEEQKEHIMSYASCGKMYSPQNGYRMDVQNANPRESLEGMMRNPLMSSPRSCTNVAAKSTTTPSVDPTTYDKNKEGICSSSGHANTSLEREAWNNLKDPPPHILRWFSKTLAQQTGNGHPCPASKSSAWIIQPPDSGSCTGGTSKAVEHQPTAMTVKRAINFSINHTEVGQENIVEKQTLVDPEDGPLVSSGTNLVLGRWIPTEPIEDNRDFTIDPRHVSSPITPTTASTSPMPRPDASTTASSGGEMHLGDKSCDFAVDWSQLKERRSMSDIRYKKQLMSSTAICYNELSTDDQESNNDYGSRSKLSNELSSSLSSARSNDESGLPVASSTRLVKVLSESGRCRYELQTITATA